MRASAPDWGGRPSLGRLLLVSLLTLLIAALSLAITVEQVLGSRSSNFAQRVWGGAKSDGALAAAQLLKSKSPADFNRVAVLARSALAREPTNGGYAGTLGLALDAAGKRDEGRRMIAYAERLTRRDLRVQLWLIEDRVRANDISGALVHYDRALRVSPEVGDILYPVLASAAEDPEIAQPLADLLARRPPWWSQFLLRLVPATQSARSLRIVVGSIAPRREDLGERQLLAFAMNRLVQLGDVRGAFALYRQAVPNSSAPDRVRNGGFDVPNDLPPFDWSLAESTSVEPRGEVANSEAAVSALRLGDAAGQPIRARQLLILPPGEYDLTAMAGDVAAEGSAAPSVQLECVQGATTSGLAVFPIKKAGPDGFKMKGRFSVPSARCTAQWLIVRAGDPGGGTQSRTPWIDEVSIQKAQSG